MRILCAPDSFKGSLNAIRVAEAIRRGIHKVAPDWMVETHPLADGGEGTLEILSQHGFKLETRKVRDQLGRDREAQFGLRDTTAVIESAQACGFDPAATSEEALRASSFGVGQLIRHALDAGATEILLTIGGTATTDGGSGMAKAIGASLSDAEGRPIPPGGIGLRELRRVDRSGFDPRIRVTKFRVLSDVTNPLLGPNGAARVFAPQKGADESAVELLEQGLTTLQRTLNSNRGQQPGAGAGGGLGFAALEFLGAEMESGAREVMNLTGFAEKLAKADLVITGEGSFDTQSLAGKVPHEVLLAARKRAVPVLMICGKSSRISASRLEETGLTGILRLTDLQPDEALSIRHAEKLLEQTGKQVPTLMIESASEGSNRLGPFENS